MEKPRFNLLPMLILVGGALALAAPALADDSNAGSADASTPEEKGEPSPKGSSKESDDTKKDAPDSKKDGKDEKDKKSDGDKKPDADAGEGNAANIEGADGAEGANEAKENAEDAAQASESSPALGEAPEESGESQAPPGDGSPEKPAETKADAPKAEAAGPQQDGEAEEAEATVAPEDEATPATEDTAEPTVGERRIIAYVFTAIAVAGLGVGIAAGLMANQQHTCLSDVIACNDGAEEPIEGGAFLDAKAELERTALIADMGYVAAAVAATVAVVSYLRGFVFVDEEGDEANAEGEAEGTP
jgi:hypothetical protein